MMINRTLKIALIVISLAIASFLVPYLRLKLGKNIMDYLNAIGSVVCGVFILVVSYEKGRRIETGRLGSKFLRISGIVLVLLGAFLLIMKVFAIY
jgi:hypothetical membrane protein